MPHEPVDLAWRLVGRRAVPPTWVKVITNRYRLPDGSEADWDLLDEGDSVAVLALTADHTVVLARQYRPGPGRILDELPGGVIDPGESPSDAAGRELLEETGYAGHIEVIGSTWNSARVLYRDWCAIATDRGSGQTQ
jgi:ADP-ribose pyrophosphatase